MPSEATPAGNTPGPEELEVPVVPAPPVIAETSPGDASAPAPESPVSTTQPSTEVPPPAPHPAPATATSETSTPESEMASLEITEPHDYTIDEAKEQIKKLLTKLRTEYSGDITAVNENEWEGYVKSFELSTRLGKISGTISVREHDVAISGKIPLTAALFKGKIEKAIRDEAKPLLRKESTPKPAAVPPPPPPKARTPAPDTGTTPASGVPAAATGETAPKKDVAAASEAGPTPSREPAPAADTPPPAAPATGTPATVTIPASLGDRNIVFPITITANPTNTNTNTPPTPVVPENAGHGSWSSPGGIALLVILVLAAAMFGKMFGNGSSAGNDAKPQPTIVNNNTINIPPAAPVVVHHVRHIVAVVEEAREPEEPVAKTEEKPNPSPAKPEAPAQPEAKAEQKTSQAEPPASSNEIVRAAPLAVPVGPLNNTTQPDAYPYSSDIVTVGPSYQQLIPLGPPLYDQQFSWHGSVGGWCPQGPPVIIVQRAPRLDRAFWPPSDGGGQKYHEQPRAVPKK